MATKHQELIALLIEKKVNLNLISDTLDTCRDDEPAIDSLIAFIRNNDPTEKQIVEELVQEANKKILSGLNKHFTTF